MNHFLRALRNLWTVLDGRHAPNPVRDVPEAIEDDPGPRALPYPIVTAILDALPDVTRPVKGGSVPAGSQTKARLTVMAWTGVAQSQLMRLRPEDVDLAGRTIYIRGRRKGRGSTGARKPITTQAVTALERFAALDCWGPFSRDSMRRSFHRACKRVETDLRERGTTIDLSRARPYDLRHAHATALLEATGDLQVTQRLMLHADPRTTARYAKAAIDPMLEAAVAAFEARVGGSKSG